MVNVAIRADGSPNIGMGHIIRCLSIAKEFKKTGYPVYFFSRYKEGIDKIKSEGFTVLELEENIHEPVEEVREITGLIKEFNIELLLIDTYNVNEEYFLKIKCFIRKLAYIDDINKFIYPVDILINGNITGECMGYKSYSHDEVMLLGPKYNLVRSEFGNIPVRNIHKEVKEIMITTGGADPFNLSLKFLSCLQNKTEFKSLTINIIVGVAFNNKELLREFASGNSNIILHENVKDMSEIMLKSDIAISSGGSTLYELCACGTPTLAFIMADNQEGIVNKFHKLGYLQSIGWHNNISEIGFLESFEKLCLDYNNRFMMSKLMQTLVDGQGAARVVQKIMDSF